MARTVIFGKSGSGKSWYSGKVIAEILEPEDEDDEFERAIHVDLEDEERGLSLKDDSLLSTFEVGKDDLRGQVLVDPDDPPEYIPDKELEDGPVVYLPKWVVYKNGYVRAVPNGLNKEEQIILAEMMASAAMRAGDCHFSMDEAHRVASDSDMGRFMSNLITGGRKRGVEWCFISQRPQLISKTVIAQADTGIFFKLSSERDVMKADKLAESFDADETLPALPNRTAIVEDYDTGEAYQVDTETLERDYPHVAGDDGKADDKWTQGGEKIGATESVDHPGSDSDSDSDGGDE